MRRLAPQRPLVCRACSRSLSGLQPSRFQSSDSHLPASPARTRFAPSPTGYIHLGSLRTALFNYLLAQRTGGQFLLRIEDTDQKKRTVPGAEQRLFDDLRWAGLQWDEGPEVGGPHGPYRQSERIPLYKAAASRLLQHGHAYRCFCSAERLHHLAAQRAELGLAPEYDRTCASIPQSESDARASVGEAFVIRFKAPSTPPAYKDIVYGKVGGRKAESTARKIGLGQRAHDDFVLLKTNDYPTYHLASVVDDHHMRITHVVRGTEWMISTPKHIALYNALGWTPPAFAHVGLLQDADGHKLSKRQGDVEIRSLRKTGILPEALVNFLALLGWGGHCGKTEFMSLETLRECFNMKWTRGNVTVDTRKLDFLQRQHAMARVDEGGARFEEMRDAVLVEVEKLFDGEQLEDILDGRKLKEYVAAILRADAKKYTTPKEFAKSNAFFFQFVDPTNAAVAEIKDRWAPCTVDALKDLRYKLEDLPGAEWATDRLKRVVQEEVAALAASLTDDSTRDEKTPLARANSAIYQGLRFALTTAKSGAPMHDTMRILGKNVCLERFKMWLRCVEDNERPGLDFVME